MQHHNVGTKILDIQDRIIEAGADYDAEREGPAREYVMRRRLGYLAVSWENSPNDPHAVRTSGADSRICNVRLLEKILKGTGK